MSDFPLPLQQIQDQQSAETIVQIFIQCAIEGTVIKKDIIKKFFDSLLNNLENKVTSPKTKFYSIYILKQVSIKQKINAKIFGTFVNHPLYQHLQNLAFNIDPKKNLSEKGKNIFANDKNTGNQMMRLILQSFIVWSQKFPRNSKGQSTKFKKTHTQLIQEKVVLPKDYIYYTAMNNKKAQSKNSIKNQEKKAESKQLPNQKASIPSQKSQSLPPVKSKDSRQKYMVQLKYIQNKIQQLMSIIQDGEQQQQIRREIKSFHSKFQKDRQKLTQYQRFIFQFNNDQLANKYINIYGFLNQQENIYNQYVLKDDYSSYLVSYKLIFQKSFEVSEIKNKKTPQPMEGNKHQISIEKKISQNNKVGQNSKVKDQQKQKLQKLNIISKKSVVKQEKAQDYPVKQDISKPYEDNIKNNRQNRNMGQSFFVKRSKSSKVAHEGFSIIAKSLQKSKLNTIVPRMKSSNPYNSNLHKTKLLHGSIHGSVMNKSGLNLKGIFANPPNANVRSKNYDGQLVIQNMQLQKQCQGVSKKQGLKRFKASIFKNKNIIYEDQFIQIGYKSSPLYEKVEKFTSFLNFQIFYGNKGNNNITKFQIFFKGDKKSLIYTNPQRIDHIIKPQEQIKMELLNVPKVLPYNFISMAASYQILGESFNLVALLPTSILQMTTYYDIDLKTIDSKWRQCSHILKTQPFKLSRHFPPDQLSHFLPKLKQKTPYIIFAQPGSTTDYELICQIVIQQAFESILKIIVRPDLNVVLQIGAYQNDQNTIRYFKFYLQSLMVTLKEFYL